MKKKSKAAKPAKISRPAISEILENGRVRVVEVTMKPGSESDSMELPVRVTRAIKGGTLTRIWPGGKKEKVTFKTGEVRFGEAVSSHVIKNSGRGTVHLFSVFLK